MRLDKNIDTKNTGHDIPASVYQIAICDDNKNDAQYVTDFVNEWASQSCIPVHIDIFPSSEAFLFRYTENKSYDILLLDIEMGAIDGVSLAKTLRQENETLQIIFITGYSDYIAEGYEVAALHYLIKPVKKEKLFSVLDRAAEKLRKNERVLNLETGGEIVRVPVYKIRYADVQGNYVTVHTGKDYTVRKTLSELDAALDERFCRVGRSVIVNLTCITRVTKADIYLNDGSIIPLPRGAYEKINRAIINMES